MRKSAIMLSIALLICGMLTGCSKDASPESSQTQPSSQQEEPSLSSGDEVDTDEEEESAPVPAEKERLPIFGNQVADGVYAIEVSSSSSMFRIVEAQLTVEGGEMTAVLTLSGTGYEKLYMGTGEEALEDTDDNCIYYQEDDEGRYTYQVPVAALDQDIDVAAWSIRKQSWYDRVLVFQSSLIPEDAIAEAQ